VMITASATGDVRCAVRDNGAMKRGAQRRYVDDARKTYCERRVVARVLYFVAEMMSITFFVCRYLTTIVDVVTRYARPPFDDAPRHKMVTSFDIERYAHHRRHRRRSTPTSSSACRRAPGATCTDRASARWMMTTHARRAHGKSRARDPLSARDAGEYRGKRCRKSDARVRGYVIILPVHDYVIISMPSTLCWRALLLYAQPFTVFDNHYCSSANRGFNVYALAQPMLRCAQRCHDAALVLPFIRHAVLLFEPLMSERRVLALMMLPLPR